MKPKAMTREDLRFYMKCLIASGVTLAVILGAFLIYFAIRYDSLKKQNYNESFEQAFSRLDQGRGFRKGTDLVYARETLQRMQKAFDAGEVTLDDFKKVRVLNQMPKDRTLNSQENKVIFDNINRVLDLKAAGKLDQWDQIVGEDEFVLERTSDLAIKDLDAPKNATPELSETGN